MPEHGQYHSYCQLPIITQHQMRQGDSHLALVPNSNSGVPPVAEAWYFPEGLLFTDLLGLPSLPKYVAIPALHALQVFGRGQRLPQPVSLDMGKDPETRLVTAGA